VKVYNSSTELLHINGSDAKVHVLHGTTVLLVCPVLPSAQSQNYNWRKGNSLLQITADAPNSYAKIHGSIVIIVASFAAEGLYKCQSREGQYYKVFLEIQGKVQLPEG
jgi:hypothetical protein